MKRLLLLVATIGCQNTYLVARGDEAMRRREPALAVANYNEALTRRAAEGRQEEIRGKRDQAALQLAREVIQAARQTAESDPDRARRDLWSFLATPTQSARAQAVVFAELQAVDAAPWDRVERLAERHHYFPAIRDARLLAAPFPREHAVWERVRSLTVRAAEHHTARGEAAGALGWFHLTLARTFGAPARRLSEKRKALDRATVGTPAIEVDPERCPTLARLAAERMMRTGVDQDVPKLRFTGCEERSRDWTTTEKRTYRDQEPKVKMVDKLVRTRSPSKDCGPCERHDPLGVCLAPAKDCVMEERVTMRPSPVIRWVDVERAFEAEVRHREASVKALVIVGEQAPEALTKKLSERAFWSPSEQRRFSGRTLESLATQLLDMSIRMAKSRGASVRTAAALARAETASTAAEIIGAVFQAGTVPASAAPFFLERFGMQPAEVQRLLQGRRPYADVRPPPPLPLPKFERDRAQERAERYAVGRRTDVGGLKTLEETGVDLAFSVSTSPLASADRGHELSGRVRVSRLHLVVKGQTPLLGGEASGFGVSLLGLLFDLEETGLYFGWGLHYEQLDSDQSERYRHFSLPVSVRVPLAEFLWVGARFDANVLFAKRIFDDEETDPHFWSPLSIWTVFDLRWGFIKVAAAHYFGKGFKDDPVQGTMTLGVRL